MSRIFLTGLIISVILVLGWAADHYYDKAVTWRTVAQQSQRLSREQAATILDANERQLNVAVLDEKYTKELANAKAELDALKQCVDSGKCRLRLKAIYTKDNCASTTGMDDATAPRLNNAAQRDYFTLRERIEVAIRQIEGLQQYIRQQCVK